MSYLKGKATRSQQLERRHGLGLLGEHSNDEMEELLSTKKKRHYDRALKEMNELVKLESLRIHLSRSNGETETDNEDEPQKYLLQENGGSISHSEEGED